jgi:S1-C subfamily serine protease
MAYFACPLSSRIAAMRTRLLLVVSCLFVAAPPAPTAEPEKVSPEVSTVRVTAKVRYPDMLKPWAKQDAVEVIGSGVVIDGKRILTNAHLVLYASEVAVQSGTDKAAATVVAVGTDVDLAVLTLKEKEGAFFKNRPALQRSATLPKVQDEVVVYGFPVGGDDLSVTKGVVSRVSFTMYSSRRPGTAIQVSAAINPGNSGGPATVDGKMVGVVFSRLAGAENIGYIIPCEEVEHFLLHLKGGRSEPRPVQTAATVFQPLENEALRRSLKLDKDVNGVLLHLPARRSPDYPFQEADVLTKVGDYELDNEGMVRLENDVLAPFTAAIPKAARDGAVPVTVLRAGKPVKASLPVTTEDNRLIRNYQGEPPSYFIHGPLAFSPVRSEAIPLYAELNPALYTTNSPMMNRRYDRVQFAGEELVVVTAPMFDHKIAKGYGDPVGRVVKEVNGVPIKNLRHLVETIRDCDEEYLTFRFAESWSEDMVFDRKEMDQATEDVLEANDIKRRASADLLKVWNATGTDKAKP